MNPLLSLKCLFNAHSPRRSQIYFDGENFRGRCRGCNRRILRTAPRRWILAPPKEAPGLTQTQT